MPKKLPVMPRGEGSFSYHKSGDIMYRRKYKGKSLTTYGSTPKEALEKMKEKIEEIENMNNCIIGFTAPLSECIQQWMITYRRNDLKETSYDALEKILRNQISGTLLGRMSANIVTSYDIQKHINKLIDHPYSYSIIKKTYELLDSFFRHMYVRNPNFNPMLIVIKPTVNGVKVKPKTIEFYNDEQIARFVEVCRQKYSTGKYICDKGFLFIFLLYTGLRIGEARALTWNDINFESNTISVTKTLADVRNRSDIGNRFISKTMTPKTKDSIRTVYMIEKAREAILSHRELIDPLSLKEYVFVTKQGANPTNVSTINKTLHRLQIRANVPIGGVHILRHTYCSLLLRAGADEWTVAKMLGHSDVDTVHKVYRGLTEKEKILITKKVNDLSKLESL